MIIRNIIKFIEIFTFFMQTIQISISHIYVQNELLHNFKVKIENSPKFFM